MLSRIVNWIKDNKATVIAAAAAVLVFGGGLLGQGCSLGDILKHPVPDGMQAVNGGKDMVSLNDSAYVMDRYLDEVEHNVESYQRGYDTLMLIHQTADALITTGIQEIGNSTIPGASILSGLLLSIAALYKRKPGDSKLIAQEKMDSHNHGVEQAMAVAASMLPAEIVDNIRKAVAEKSEAS
jgi:hypothetical protein